ncbi:SUKH-4 family immunity protein [Streptomyces sp. NPDC047000]|uniref:SUKH-4 family immunity protein n=1 Tax=Streptomyces sp. NPDC047000 TaxID=3155474 RepID=UPI0033D4E7FB
MPTLEATADDAAMIILTEADLGPYVTHAPTRDWLTGPGLPPEIDLLTFAALRTDGLRTVADVTAAPDLLDRALRDRLVIGGLIAADGATSESILLDGTTGEISTTYFFQDRPDLMDELPLAPSLEILLRFAAVTEELATLRGRFAQYATDRGPQAVVAASRALLSLFEEDTDGEVPPYWRMAALIRPLSLIAGPGTHSGLTLDLPLRLLDEEFGAGEIVRFEDVDFPAALTHEPTRRFLREVGLPEDGTWFTLDTDVPLPTLAEYEPADLGTAIELPENADRLIDLGYLLEDTCLVVDGTTGEVLCWSTPDAALRPLNADLSTLAYTLWLIHREKALDSRHGLTEAYEQLADTLTRTLAALDPTACAPTPRTPTDDGLRYWPQAFEDQAGGGLYP